MIQSSGHPVQHKREEVPASATKVAKVTYLPLDDKCVVYIIQAGNMSEGGIVIPDISRDKMVTTRVKVLAVGPDVKRVQVGDVCLVGLNTQVDLIRHKGQETLVLAECQFYGIELAEEQG